MEVKSIVVIERVALKKKMYELLGRRNELVKELEACNDPGKKTGKNIKICELEAVADFIQKELLKEEEVNSEVYGVPCIQIG